MTLEFHSYPGGPAIIQYGLGIFEDVAAYDRSIIRDFGCIPSKLNCIVSLLCFLCTTKKTVSGNDKEDKDLITKLEALEKVSDVELALKPYIDKKICVTFNKVVFSRFNYSYFFENNATETVKFEKFTGKLIIGVYLYKNDVFIINCIKLYPLNTINSLTMDYCFETFQASIGGTHKDLINITTFKYASLWHYIQCPTGLNFTDCGYVCNETDRNVCENSLEKCIEAYAQQPTLVTYLDPGDKSLILKRMEPRCTFINKCLDKNVTCPPKQICIPVSHNQYQCGAPYMAIEGGGNLAHKDLIDFHNMIWLPDIFRCIWSNYFNFCITLLNGAVVSQKGDTHYIYVYYYYRFHKYLNVTCLYYMNEFVPPTVKTWILKTITMFETTNFISLAEHYLILNERVLCTNDGTPEDLINTSYIFNASNSKLIRSVSNNGFVIPNNTELGPAYIECNITWTNPLVQEFRVINVETVVVKHHGFGWAPNSEIIYEGDIVSCSVIVSSSTALLQIVQIAGRSAITFENNSIRFDSKIAGGFYSFLCYLELNKNRYEFRYVRPYSFFFHKKATTICFGQLPGSQNLKIYCLHNGYPLTSGETQINLTQLLDGGKSSSIMSINSKHLVVNRSIYDYFYQVECYTKIYDREFYDKISFSLQENSGLIYKYYNDSEHKLCDTELVEDYLQYPLENFEMESQDRVQFQEFRIMLLFIIAVNLIGIAFFLSHYYSFDPTVGLSMAIHGLSRRHCIIRLYNKMIELSLFRVRNCGTLNIDPLRKKFEKFKGLSSSDNIEPKA